MSFLTLRPPPNSTLFPYTTLFRSLASGAGLLPSPAAAEDLPYTFFLTRYEVTRAGDRLEAVRYHSDGQPFATAPEDRKSTRLNSSHVSISYAVFCLKKKKTIHKKR